MASPIPPDIERALRDLAEAQRDLEMYRTFRDEAAERAEALVTKATPKFKAVPFSQLGDTWSARDHLAPHPALGDFARATTAHQRAACAVDLVGALDRVAENPADR